MTLDINSMNVYVPAKDFELSKRFYAALGFTLTEAWGGNFDCRLGNSLFRLQNYYVEGWANNFMLQFQVDDANAWYEHAKAIIDLLRARRGRAGGEAARRHIRQLYQEADCRG